MYSISLPLNYLHISMSFFNSKLRISFVKLQTIFLSADWFNQSDLLPTVHHLTFSTKYGRGGHLGHVTRTILNKLSFPRPKESPYEI